MERDDIGKYYIETAKEFIENQGWKKEYEDQIDNFLIQLDINHSIKHINTINYNKYIIKG